MDARSPPFGTPEVFLPDVLRDLIPKRAFFPPTAIQALPRPVPPPRLKMSRERATFSHPPSMVRPLFFFIPREIHRCFLFPSYGIIGSALPLLFFSLLFPLIRREGHSFSSLHRDHRQRPLSDQMRYNTAIAFHNGVPPPFFLLSPPPGRCGGPLSSFAPNITESLFLFPSNAAPSRRCFFFFFPVWTSRPGAFFFSPFCWR